MKIPTFFRTMVAAILLSLSFTLRAEVTTVLSEQFESGIPTAWTQEHIRGQQDWVFESSSLSNPAGAAQGKGRVALRNTTNQTLGFRTKLITPAMDLMEVSNPVLSFQYAQSPRAGQFDTLRVYYRPGADKVWQLLKEFDSYSSKWQSAQINVDIPSKTAQFAFEGSDNLGYGVVLDNVEVKSCPTCNRPQVVVNADITENSASVTLGLSESAEKIRVILSTEPLGEVQLASSKEELGAFYDEVIDPEVYLPFSGLEFGKDYHVYVRAFCGDLNSQWSLPVSFTTLKTVEVPFRENFDAPLTGVRQQVKHWSFGTDYTYTDIPFVNTNFEKRNLQYYSPTGTTCLLFAGEKCDGTNNQGIAAGNYAYAATPELRTDDISTLQVSFVGGASTAFYLGGMNNPAQVFLIVGTMTDPADIGTFQAVDTVYLQKERDDEFQRFVVPLTNARKDDRHVALLSKSDDVNTFYVDDFAVEEIPACSQATELKVSLTAATSAAVSWTGAEKGEVVFLKNKIGILDTLDRVLASLPETDYIRSEVANGGAVTALAPWTQYYAYVRNICGTDKGAWSTVAAFRTSVEAVSVPHTFDFEITPGDPSSCYLLNGGNYYLPNGMVEARNNSDAVVRAEAYKGMNNSYGITAPSAAVDPNAHLNGKEYESTSSYLAFPEVADLKNTRVQFYAKQNNYDYAHIIVGASENPFDTTSFTPVDTIIIDKVWTRYVVDMNRYAFDGNFFTMRFVLFDLSDSRKYLVKTNIDNLSFLPAPVCANPDKFTVEAETDNAVIKWNNPGAAASWSVRVADKEAYAELENAGYSWAFKQDGLTEAEVTATGLKPNQTKYWYYLQQTCKDATEPSPWEGPYTFKTQCEETRSLEQPVTIDYNSTFKYFDLVDGTYYFPCLDIKGADEKNKVYMFNGNTFIVDVVEPADGEYIDIVLPRFDNPMNKTIVEINYSNFNWGKPDTLIVGAVKADMSGFEAVASFSNNFKPQGKYYFSRFDDTFTNIVVRVPKTIVQKIQLNNVKVSRIDGCAEISKLSVDSVSYDAARFSWKGDIEEAWDVVVARPGYNQRGGEIKMTADSLNRIMSGDAKFNADSVVFCQKVTRNPLLVGNLDYNSQYKIYVRTACSDTERGPWYLNAPIFRTSCSTLSLDALGVEGFEKYNSGEVPTCWSASSIRGTMPKVVNKATLPDYSQVKPIRGERMLHISSGVAKNDSDAVYFISPEIALPEGEDMSLYQVSFWGFAPFDDNEAKVGRLSIGVSSEIGKEASFEELDVVYNYGKWHRYTIPFDQYVGDFQGTAGNYVTFRSASAKPSDFYVDEITIEPVADCLAPYMVHVKDSTISSDRVSLAWYAMQDNATIRISDHQLDSLEINKPISELEGVEERTFSDLEVEKKGSLKTVTLDNLEGATRYYIYVGGLCNGTMAWSSPVSFKTICAANPIPFYENFEANPTLADNNYRNLTPNKPQCWMGHCKPEDATAPRHNQFPRAVADAYNSKVAMRLFQTTGNYETFALVPELTGDIKAAQISFMAKSGSYSMGTAPAGPFQVIIGQLPAGKLNAEDYRKNFMPLDTVTADVQWAKFIVSLENFDAEKGGRVVFLTELRRNPDRPSITYQDQWVSIDDVAVEPRPLCNAPAEISCDSVSDVAARIVVAAVEGNAAWDYSIVAAGEERGDETAVVPVTDKTFVIEGLAPATAYDVYVRARNANGDPSEWVGPLAIRTYTHFTKSYETAYTEGFESVADGDWAFVNGETNGFFVGTAAAAAESTKSLYISADNGSSAKYTATASRSYAYRTFYFPSGVYNISYNWKGVGENGADYAKVGLVPADSYLDGAFTPVMDKSHGELSGTADWTAEVVDNFIVSAAQEGYYNLVVSWVNDASEVTADFSFALDNLTIRKEACVLPTDVKVTAANHNSATVEWNMLDDTEGLRWEVYVSDKPTPDLTDAGANINKGGYVNGHKADIKDLTEQTTYYAYVRTVCKNEAGEDIFSSWSETAATFETTCAPVAVGEVYNFDDIAEGAYLGECFNLVNSGSSPFGILKNGSVFSSFGNRQSSYSRSGENVLAVDPEYSSSGVYFTLPAVSESLVGYQLTFWMRPLAVNVNGNVDKEYYKGTSFVTVGSISNVNDPSSFVPVDTCEYPYTTDEFYRDQSFADDPAGNNYWVKFSVPLRACNGKFVAVGIDHQKMGSLGALKNTVFIDDMVIEPLSTCATPKISVATVTDHSATLHFETDNWYEYEVQYAESLDSLVAGKFSTFKGQDSEAAAGNMVIDNLKPNTKYYFCGRANCTATDKSDFTLVGNFTTALPVRFFEDFSGNVNVPDGWDRLRGMKLDDVYYSGGSIPYGSTLISDTSYWAHSKIDANASAHQRTSLVNNSLMDAANWWLFTPVVYLRDGMEAHLSFDVMLTRRDVAGNYEAPDLKSKSGYRFIVLVSDDGGATYREENSVIWDGSKENRNFYDFTNIPTTVELDLAKFEGKAVRVAFYVEAGAGRADKLDFRLDNVNINSVFRRDFGRDEICEYYDYIENGFDVPYSKLVVTSELHPDTVNHLERSVISTGDELDTVYTVDVMVHPMPITYIDGETCEGQPYDENGFTNVTTAGEHRLVLPCNSGIHCDSVVVLSLTVNTSGRGERFASFCEGGSYEFAGETFYEPGDHVVNVPVPGECDSIITLHLTQISSIKVDSVCNLCFGDVVTINGMEYRSDGSFEQFTVPETIRHEGTCDSVITHHITYANDYIVTAEAAICLGEKYTGNGFKDLIKENADGYHVTNTTSYGCDSIVNLYLTVINPGETERSITRKINRNELPYTFYGKTWGVDTEDGVYTENGIKVKSESGECEITVNLTLQIGEATGVDNIRYSTLTVSPNPVDAGSDVRIDLDMTYSERQNLVVEVYNTSGALVNRVVPQYEPVTITAPEASGIYMVRVTDGNGNVFHGKLIVR